MPAYNRVVLSGTLATATEAFSCGINFASPGGASVGTPAALGEWATAIANSLGTLTGASLDRGLSTAGAITEVATYFYPSIGAPAVSVGRATAFLAGLGTSLHPLPTSAVMSLRTGISGRRHRGRVYWPALAWTVNASGKFAGTDPQVAPVEFAEMLEGIANLAPNSVELEPVVVSGAGDFVTPVTSVAVGDVPDTQRRRRDNLAEQYSVSPYPAP